MFQKSCFTILTGDRRISLPSTVLLVKNVPLHSPAMQSSIAGWMWKHQSWKRNEIGIFHCDLFSLTEGRFYVSSLELLARTWNTCRLEDVFFLPKIGEGILVGSIFCFWASKNIWKTIAFLIFDGRFLGSSGEMNQICLFRCKHVQNIRWPIKSFKTPPKLDSDTVVGWELKIISLRKPTDFIWW